MYLAIGRRVFSEGAFPTGDPFLFTNLTSDWLAHWGTHVLTYSLFRLGGWNMLVLAKVFVVVSGAAAAFWLRWRLRDDSVAAAAATLLGLWAGADRFIERSSLLSDCLGAWMIALLCVEIVKPSRWRWSIPAIIAFWINLHPGAITALALVGAAVVASARDWRRWVPLGLTCVVAATLHPRGAVNLWRTVISVFGPKSSVIRDHYWEFMPTFSQAYVHTTQIRLFALLLVVTAVVLVATWRRNPIRWFAALVLLELAYLGSSSVRFVTTASFALPVLITALVALRDRTAPEHARSRWGELSLRLATAIAGLALCIKVIGWGYTTQSGPRRIGIGLDEAMVPTVAARFVASLPINGHLFNEHAFGSFLAWQWDGRPALFYHGLVMIVDPVFYERDYLGANRSAEDFDRVIRDHDISLFFLARPQVGEGLPPLYRMLSSRPDWHLVYWDPIAVVFLRDRPGHESLIRANEYRYFNPFKPDRVAVGLQEAPARLKEEAERALRDSPANVPAQNLMRMLGR
jgi:hypothetical protein